MKKYYRTICFSSVPLTSVFRYKEWFQIFPSDLTNQPQYSKADHFPLIIESWIPDDGELFLPRMKTDFDNDYVNTTVSDTGKQIVNTDNIIFLLSAFTNHRFFKSESSGGVWGVPVVSEDIKEQAKNMTSTWCWPMFHFPELPDQFPIREFSKISLPKVNLVPHKSYYVNYPNLDYKKKDPITFPDSIEMLFDAYSSLASSEKGIFDNACAYIVSSMELRSKRKTLSMLAAFTAMETMVNLDDKTVNTQRCQNCNQLQYKVSQKFREFLLKYIGRSDKNKAKFNKIYSKRSKIVHRGERLESEYLFSDVTEEIVGNEIQEQVEVLQIGKMAVVNWLLINALKFQMDETS